MTHTNPLSSCCNAPMTRTLRYPGKEGQFTYICESCLKPCSVNEGKQPKYSGMTKDGYFIQSDNIEHFRLEELTSFMITETMTEEEVRRKFGTDYELPKDFKNLNSSIVINPKMS